MDEFVFMPQPYDLDFVVEDRMVEIITEKSHDDDNGETFQHSLPNNDVSPKSLSDHSYNSDEVSSGTMTISIKEEPKKRRGGWPKGKKRKMPPSIALPKAPVTGYLLYINEKRHLLKKTNPDIAFSEATRILGNEWSAMPVTQKQVYLDKAEADKKRYASDLVSYKKKLEKDSVKKDSTTKDVTQFPINEKNENKTMEINLESLDEEILFCEICNQYFFNIHNKKEHLNGKLHLTNMTNRMGKKSVESEGPKQRTDSLTHSSTLKCHATNYSVRDNCQNFLSNSVSKAMEDVIAFNMERESEIMYLKSTNQNLKENKKTLLKELKILEESKAKASLRLENLKAISTETEGKLLNLRMVPTLFGVINF